MLQGHFVDLSHVRSHQKLSARPANDIVALRERSWHLTQALLHRRDALLEVLTQTASRDSAEDEFSRSIRVLGGASWEIARFDPPKIDQLSVFLPSNNVLYSYVLFGLVPSLYCDQVVIRPSSRTRNTASAVHEIVTQSIVDYADRIELTSESQRNFVGRCEISDAVVFTGQYENGVDIMSRLSERALYLMFGSGPNPLIVGPRANQDVTRRALLGARLYNSGQDCLCSDIIFVHQSRLNQILDMLMADLARIEKRGMPTSSVYPDAVTGAKRYLTTHANRVVFGGAVDTGRLVVSPTVVLHSTADGLQHPPEFFSPIFSIVPYNDVAEIFHWACSSLEMERGMFAMVFGEPRITDPRLGSAVVLHDMTTFDHEDGNKPFGGFGVRASSARTIDGSLSARPLLLSAELARRYPR